MNSPSLVTCIYRFGDLVLERGSDLLWVADGVNSRMMTFFLSPLYVGSYVFSLLDFYFFTAFI